MDTNMRK